MSGCVSYTEQEYKDSLAAKHDTAREEIAADFAQRNADLKDYVQPVGAPKIPLLSLLQQVNKNPKVQDAERELCRETFRSIAAASDSDGFYGRVPYWDGTTVPHGGRTISGLLNIISTQQDIIRDLVSK